METPLIIPINKKQEYTQSPAAYIDYYMDNEQHIATGLRRFSYDEPQVLNSPSICVIYHNENPEVISWDAKLSLMGRLKEGWNGYRAPAPSERAIANARNFISVLFKHGLLPKRVAPSAVGGIGITQSKANRTAYVEFYNDGKVLALLSDDESEPDIKRIEPTLASFKRLIEEVQGYLDG